MCQRTVHTPPPRRLIRLRNRTCAYCGAPFGKTQAHTDEHVIGRNFVPKGSLSGVWNLVLYACKKCNDEKCDLENDISVISMLPARRLSPGQIDSVVAAEIQRKAPGAVSRRTGKPVVNSDENVRISSQFGDVTISMNFVAPPQIDDARICELACFHVQGFFHQMTFDWTSKTGRFLSGDFHHWAAVPCSDWGNYKLKWFSELVLNWLPCLRADGADGYFRIHLRRHKDLGIMSWALEWNKGMRVVGFVGATDAITHIISSCPIETAGIVHDDGNERLVFREHVALDCAQDTLFGWQGFEG